MSSDRQEELIKQFLEINQLNNLISGIIIIISGKHH